MTFENIITNHVVTANSYAELARLMGVSAGWVRNTINGLPRSDGWRCLYTESKPRHKAKYTKPELLFIENSPLPIHKKAKILGRTYKAIEWAIAKL